VVFQRRFQDSVFLTTLDCFGNWSVISMQQIRFNPTNFRASRKIYSNLDFPSWAICETCSEAWPENFGANEKIVTGESQVYSRKACSFNSKREWCWKWLILGGALMLMVSDRLFSDWYTERAIEFILKLPFLILPTTNGGWQRLSRPQFNFYPPASWSQPFLKSCIEWYRHSSWLPADRGGNGPQLKISYRLPSHTFPPNGTYGNKS